MKAVLDQDIIIYITEKGDTEIGAIPPNKKDVGLERLRWDGTKIVDLADMSEIWVKSVSNNFYELHAVKVLDTQKVQMTYRDRKNLIIEDGIIRVKTALEIENGMKIEQESMTRNQLRQAFKRDVGDIETLLADTWKLISLIIIFVRTNDPQIAVFLDNILPDLEKAYPPKKIKDQIGEHIVTIKNLMQEYYQITAKK